jgi:hypothetical protein
LNNDENLRVVTRVPKSNSISNGVVGELYKLKRNGVELEAINESGVGLKGKLVKVEYS